MWHHGYTLHIQMSEKKGSVQSSQDKQQAFFQELLQFDVKIIKIGQHN